MDELSEPTTKRKPGRELLVLVGIVGVLILLIAVYVFTLGRSPLAGPNTHDFGYVMLGEGGATVEHTFTLTNRTSRPLELGRPRPSCGCTVSDLSSDIVEPGEAVSVTAVLTLTRAGRRSSEIAIPIEGRGVRLLHITGVGRPTREIHTRRQHLQLWHEHEAVLGFHVDAWPDAWEDVSDLPAPTITVPEGVTARLVHWSMSRQPERDGPAHWTGRVSVALESETDAAVLTDDATLMITAREGHSLRIPLVAGEPLE